METVRVYLGLGSNIGDPLHNLALAREALQELAAPEGLFLFSPVYETEPQEYKRQSWFFNQNIQMEVPVETDPEAFLASVQAIEHKMGRVRNPENQAAPRTIDIDILLFGERSIHSDHLTIPHPRLTERAFALVPLADLDPNLEIENDGEKHRVTEWLARLHYSIEKNQIYQA